MTQTSFPFENLDTTEAQFSKWATALASSGIISGTALTAGSGMTVDVASGSAIVRGFYWESDATVNLAVAAAHSTYQRKDYVVLTASQSGNSVTLAVVTGSADAGGGTLPALTQNSTTWQMPIGIVTVPAAAVSLVSGNVASNRAYLGLRVHPYASSADRPTVAAGETALGINTTNKMLEIGISGTWYEVTPQLTWDSILSKPSTFTPSAHTHLWADTTDKPTTFTPSAHTHTTAEISNFPSWITDTRNTSIRIFVQNTTMNSTDNVAGDLRFW